MGKQLVLRRRVRSHQRAAYLYKFNHGLNSTSCAVLWEFLLSYIMNFGLWYFYLSHCGKEGWQHKPTQTTFPENQIKVELNRGDGVKLKGPTVDTQDRGTVGTLESYSFRTNQTKWLRELLSYQSTVFLWKWNVEIFSFSLLGLLSPIRAQKFGMIETSFCCLWPQVSQSGDNISPVQTWYWLRLIVT